MNSLVILAIMIAGYILAYHTYSKFLARKIFRFGLAATCPGKSREDNIDYVPTRKSINALYTALPMVFMVFMTGWAMISHLNKFYHSSNWLLLEIGAAVFLLELWMIVESLLVLDRVYRRPKNPGKLS